MKTFALHHVIAITWLIAMGRFANAESWSQFRGPTGQGHSEAKRLPLEWNDTTNIAWRSSVPGLGWSSPVVVDNEIWLTSALDDGKSLRVLCYTADAGRLVHDVEVFGNNQPKAIHGKNSHASPSVVVENDRVYAHFGTYGTACITTDGTIVWRRKLDYEPRHGPGGSPVLFEDLVIINCDGTDVQYVVALDKANGEIRWKTNRTHASEARLSGKKMAPMAFSTPLVVEVDGRNQVISAGGDHVAGYDVRKGTEIWWSEYDGYSIVPRPVVGGGLVFVSSCYDGPVLYAIRLGGNGNVTDTHVAWTLTKGAPHNPSPVIVDDMIFVIDDRGIATCLDVQTGKRHWQKRLGGNFSASPLFADGRIYFTDEEGTTTVIAPDKKFTQLSKNSIEGKTLASLAPIDGAIIFRNESALYRIEQQQ